MNRSNFVTTVAVSAGLSCVGGATLAQSDCADLGFASSYLNDFFCQRLTELADSPEETPTRSFDQLDDETRAFIEGLPIASEAYHTDPRRTLDLIARIRAAGTASGRGIAVQE